MCDLTSRTVLITGASKGIGAETAIHLARLGATVALHFHLDAGGATQTLENVRSSGGHGELFQADLRDPLSVVSLFAEVDSKLGGLDVAILNAGVSRLDLAHHITPEKWRSVMSVNLDGAFLCAKEALARMAQSEVGRLIFIGSAAGMMGGIGQAHYAASKSALV